MKLESYLKKVNMKEIIICLSLIVIGYMTAQLFMRKYNRFSVGGQNSCPLGSDLTCKLGTYPQRPGGGAPSPDPCSKVKADDCNKSWWQSKSDGAGNKPIGVGCKYIKNKCITPGTGFKTINGCPTKSCDGSPPPPPSNSKTSYNCNASKCVSVSGTSGTYSSESDCQSKCGSPPPPPPPSFSCSSTWNNSDICLNNNKAVDYTKWSASCTDNDDICKGCQKNCDIWYKKGGILANLIIGPIVFFFTIVGAFVSSGTSQIVCGILLFLSCISIIFSIYFYLHNKTVTPGGEN